MQLSSTAVAATAPTEAPVTDAKPVASPQRVWSLRDVQMAAFNVHQALASITEVPCALLQLPHKSTLQPQQPQSLVQLGIPVPAHATSTPVDRHIFDSSPEASLQSKDSEPPMPSITPSHVHPASTSVSGASAHHGHHAPDMPPAMSVIAPVTAAADGTPVARLRAEFLRDACGVALTRDAHTEDALLVQTMLRAAGLDYDEGAVEEEGLAGLQDHAAVGAVVEAAQQAWTDSWAAGPTNVMDVVTMAIAATGKPSATIQEIWEVL